MSITIQRLQTNLLILRTIRACYINRIHPNMCLYELEAYGITDKDLARYRGWRASTQGERA